MSIRKWTDPEVKLIEEVENDLTRAESVEKDEILCDILKANT